MSTLSPFVCLAHFLSFLFAPKCLKEKIVKGRKIVASTTPVRHFFSFSSFTLSKQQQTKEEKRREDLIALCTHQGRERREREETRVKANTVICSQSNYTQNREKRIKKENRRGTRHSAAAHWIIDFFDSYQSIHRLDC
jgi:hypothetical protein